MAKSKQAKNANASDSSVKSKMTGSKPVMSKRRKKTSRRHDLIAALLKKQASQPENESAEDIQLFNSFKQDLSESIPSLSSKPASGTTKSTTKTSYLKKAHLEERNKLLKVIQLDVFQKNPFEAIQKHIQNSSGNVS